MADESDAHGGTVSPARGRKAGRDPADRRRAILDAALVVFAERGFAGARMQDVATRAGVAKGTLYLYFKAKEALFEGLVREAIDPVLGRMEREFAEFTGSTRQFLSVLFAHLANEAVRSPRRHVIRLLLGEGERFPELADFYYREVVSRGLGLLRAINARALERGEISSDAGLRFPQLLVAPLLVATAWEGLFQRNETLDVAGMLEAHAEIVLRGLGWRDS
ncbi:TetR/AcrR family transcriptional regulator [Ancylobacter pratisalsi]|uniref:TetR/AcrR family transcriptional regulator n=1 Tax=Ancylobacter pratisalsi TaxID=1745854 RepID=A0A6P1YS59_9HYPH|nr:TetR/AcrR family transcriptional regulator [Ancylobacter pratisalsi]QIB35536.1 TetR/AcrR family transcriptional regulator [Ancylobacter pratisalsi]